MSTTREPPFVRWALTAAALTVLMLLVLLPVANVFANALGDGLSMYLAHLGEPDTLHAIGLTLSVAACAVLLNAIFGLAAAWAIARFRFPGRTVLVTLIDLPFSVSPVVAGLIFVLLFGTQGWFGPWLRANGMQILFAWPGLVLTTTFVTLPFVARELIPVMEAIGPDEELAAVSLGARPHQLFWLITLPNIKWGLLYGLILCNARAMGEFGAVYVVSGRIPGETLTMPLRVEMLYQDGELTAAFTVASMLTVLSIATLILKVMVERLSHRAQREQR